MSNILRQSSRGGGVGGGKQLKALDPIVVNRAERRMTWVEENLRLVEGVLVMQQNFEPVENYGWILQVKQRRELK